MTVPSFLPHRRPRRGSRPGGVGGGGVGGPGRAGRGARRRGGLPARQDLRRRADAARDRRAAAARASRTGCARTPSTRACAPTGSARRCCCRGPGGIAARLGLRGGPHRARRPPAHHRDQGRRAARSTAPGRSTYACEGGRVAAVVFERAGDRRTASRSPAGGWSWPTACARRWASCSGREWHRDTVYGVAGRSYVASDDVRRPVDQLAPRAARRAAARSCPATAGSSRSAPAR